MRSVRPKDDTFTTQEREMAHERVAALARRFYFEAMSIGCHPFLGALLRDVARSFERSPFAP